MVQFGTMGKKGKKKKAGKLSKGDRKRAIADLEVKLEALAKRLQDELKDVDLFEPVSEDRDDCDICFVPLPMDRSDWKFSHCCGKFLCSGCAYKSYVDAKARKEKPTCPFCRSPEDPAEMTPEEYHQKMEVWVEKGVATATQCFASDYHHGDFLLAKDELKGVELFLRAAELGSAEALADLGKVYQIGTLLKPDDQKARIFVEAGAKKGSTSARYGLGVFAMADGLVWNAKRHWTLGALAGCQTNLDGMKSLFMNGHATKDEYIRALRGHGEAFAKERTDARDEWITERKWREAIGIR